jgi:prevent-host-death family protein
MKLAGQIKSVSTFKAKAAEMIEDITETGNPVILTVNGEAKVIVQDMREYEEAQNRLALLEILAIGDREVREGRGTTVRETFAKIRRNVKL